MRNFALLMWNYAATANGQMQGVISGMMLACD